MQRHKTRYPARARLAARLYPLFCLLAVLTLTLTLSVAVRADSEVQVPAVLTPLISPVPEAGAISIDTFDAGHLTGWISGSNLSQPGLRLIDSSRCMVATPLPDAADGDFTLTRLFGEADRLNLIDKARITAALRIEGDAVYNVRLTLYSGLSVLTAETALSGNGWYAISADISDWHLRTAIDAVEITVTAPAGDDLSYIALGSLNASGEASMELVSAFLTFGFAAEGGTAEYESGAYLLDAGDDGAMTLVADAAREDYEPAGGITALRIVLDGAMEGGTLSLAVSDAFSGVSSFSIASSCKTYYGLNTYLLPFDSSISLRAYQLSFRDLQADTAGVRLLSVSLVQLPKTSADNALGRLSSCIFAEDMSSLSVTGTIPGSTVTSYINGTLALYEIPVWENADVVIAAGEPLAVSKISTRFSFTADLTDRQATAAVSRYAVVLRTEEETILLCEPRFPDFPTDTERDSRSIVGLADADAAGVFTANAANVLVDVYVDRLLGGVKANTSGRLCVRGGRYYYLDYEYLSELDTVLNFYAAADVDVYLRLICATDLSFRAFTFARADADYYAFDVTNEDGAYMLSAVTDYIASRHPELRGFVVGQRLDDARLNGANLSDLKKYAALCADTMRIVYNAAVPYIPDVTVMAPVGHTASEAASAAANYGDSTADPVLFTVALSRKLEADGGMPWGLLYSSDNASEMLGHTENLLGRMKVMEAAAPDFLYFLWQPGDRYDPDILLSEYAERCTSAARAGARVLFLELAPLPDADLIYGNLKYVHADGDNRRTLSEFSAEILTQEPDPLFYAGVYPLYDFTGSFSTLHWIAGSGCDSLTTQLATMTAGTRALHAQFGSSETYDPVSGSILCMLPAALDFTPAPEITCTLLVTSSLESTATADIVFVLGSDDDRAEYKVTVPVGQIVTVRCHLADYEKSADISSLAILVQAESPVTLDISRLLCCSRTVSDDALTAHFSIAGTDDDTGTHIVLTDRQIVTLLLAVASSLSVFALLTRRVRNKEEEARKR